MEDLDEHCFDLTVYEFAAAEQRWAAAASAATASDSPNVLQRAAERLSSKVRAKKRGADADFLSASDSFLVLTYNIWFDAKFAARRTDLLCALIAQRKPSIICLQGKN